MGPPDFLDSFRWYSWRAPGPRPCPCPSPPIEQPLGPSEGEKLGEPLHPLTQERGKLPWEPGCNNRGKPGLWPPVSSTTLEWVHQTWASWVDVWSPRRGSWLRSQVVVGRYPLASGLAIRPGARAACLMGLPRGGLACCNRPPSLALALDRGSPGEKVPPQLGGPRAFAQ